MTHLTRFGISMEDDLLRQFDALIAHKGYTNRSEAVRDILRDKLVEESVQPPDAETFGALVFLYDHHKRELEKSLSSLQHEFFANIISTSHVHVDHDHCLEVVLLKGRAGTLKMIAERLLTFKGVQHGKLTLTASLPSSPIAIKEHPHAHSPHNSAHHNGIDRIRTKRS